MTQTYYSPKSHSYYFCSHEEPICDKCKQPINKIVIFNKSYDKTHHDINTFCLKCIGQTTQHIHVSETFYAVIVAQPPKDSFPILMSPTTLQALSSLDTFAAAEQTEAPAEKIVNKAKVSFNPNRNIMVEYTQTVIQQKKTHKMMEHKFEDLKDVEKFMDGYVGAEPILAAKEKKLIEGKR